MALSVDSRASHFLGFSGVLFTSARVLLPRAPGTPVAALPLPNSLTKSVHHFLKKVKEPGLAVHTFNPSTGGAEAGGSL